MTVTQVEDVIDGYTGNARRALRYNLITKQLLDDAKQPGFSTDSWAPPAELVAVDGSVRRLRG